MIQQSVNTVERSNHGNGQPLRSEVQRYYETLLHRLPWPAAGSGSALRTLGITSCQSGEGVSTVAAHLAITAASLGKHQILLVDANFARPSVPQIFRVPASPGLAEMCREGCELTDVLQPSEVANLSLVVAGRAAGGTPFHDLAGLSTVIKELAADFDLVVIDLPASGQSGAGLRLAGLLDGILLVVEAERVRRDVAQQVCDSLIRTGARPLGVVLNKWQQRVPEWLYRTL